MNAGGNEGLVGPDLDARERALETREKAVDARERAVDAREKASRFGSPMFLALLAAIFALGGNIVVTYFNNKTLHEKESRVLRERGVA
jgi:hypothetical protein